MGLLWVTLTLGCTFLSLRSVASIRGQGEYKQFASNRVLKIKEHQGLNWNYVPLAENLADVGKRGGRTQESHVWWHGPEWLTTPEIWPTDVVNEPSEATLAEAKFLRKVLNAAVNDEDDIQRVFNRFQLLRPYEFVHVRKELPTIHCAGEGILG